MRLTRRGVLLGGAQCVVFAVADIRLVEEHGTDNAPIRFSEQSDFDYEPSLLEPMLA